MTKVKRSNPSQTCSPRLGMRMRWRRTAGIHVSRFNSALVSKGFDRELRMSKRDLCRFIGCEIRQQEYVGIMTENGHLSL
jgi:hypothetical protein